MAYIICYRDPEYNKCLIQPAFEPITPGMIGGLVLELLEICSRENLDARLEHLKQTLNSYVNGYNLKRRK